MENSEFRPTRADLYEILRVPRTASKQDIQKAYLQLARQCHPDCGGDPRKFREVVLAFKVLSDQVKRAEYDGSLNATFDELRGPQRDTGYYPLPEEYLGTDGSFDYAKFASSFPVSALDRQKIGDVAFVGNFEEFLSRRDAELAQFRTEMPETPETVIPEMRDMAQFSAVEFQLEGFSAGASSPSGIVPHVGAKTESASRTLQETDLDELCRNEEQRRNELLNMPKENYEVKENQLEERRIFKDDPLFFLGK
ncbi:MAG: J domain-containing protein [Sulfobacillus sp.]